MMEQPIDESLLIRFFSRTLSEEEKQEVENWINSSEEHKKQARQIAQIYFASGLLQTTREVNSSEKLRELFMRIERKQKRNAWKVIGRVAAMLALPVVIISAYYWNSGRNIEETMEQLVEVRTQIGMTDSVVLPDSSVVYLNSGTLLKYPARFADNRKVYLQGEAFFVVKKRHGMHFIVHTQSGAKVEVLGTEFNVNSTRQEASATLVKGSVQLVYSDKERQEMEYRIVPGQKISYNSVTKEMQVQEVDVDAEISWTGGLTTFKDCPLMDILDVLSKQFNTDFIVKNEALKENRFTGDFKHQSLKLILDNLAISTGMKYKYVNDNNSSKDTLKRETIELY